MYLNFFCSKVSFGLLDFGLGIWDIVDGVKALTTGNKKAKKFREAGQKLTDAKIEILKLFDYIKDRCDGSNEKVHNNRYIWIT